MALSLVDVGTTANDGTGDPLRTAFQTVNTALTAVNNAVVVGTGTTTFKDDSGTIGVAVASNGDVTFTNAGATVGMKWDASANSNAGGLGLGTATPASTLHIETAGSTQFRVVSSPTGSTSLMMGDTADNTIGRIVYVNTTDELQFWAGGVAGLSIHQTRDVRFYNAGGTIGMNWDASAQSNTGALGINESVPDYRLDVNGTFGFTPGSSVTPVDNGDIVFEATSNTTFTVKLKGSDGVVRSGTITLA